MSFRIQSLHLKNYGNLPEFHCEKFTGLNLIIGENATGKTFLLKSLYSAVRAMEDYKRGDDIRPMVDILSDKLRWTFQADKLGDLVTRSAAEGLTFKMQSDQQDMALEYQFSQSAPKWAAQRHLNLPRLATLSFCLQKKCCRCSPSFLNPVRWIEASALMIPTMIW